jgi:hypothetical protein
MLKNMENGQLASDSLGVGSGKWKWGAYKVYREGNNRHSSPCYLTQIGS